MINFKKYTKIATGLCIVFVVCIVSKYLSAREIFEENRKNFSIDTIAYTPTRVYKLSKIATPNEITDRQNNLTPLWEKLSALRTLDEKIQTVSVVHLGDSHIQADFFTGTVRKLMNQHFGNPGRGLVAPNRLMKSNNGRHYRITSGNLWKHSFVMKPNHIPIGIAGFGLQVNDTTANINLLTVDDSIPGEWDFDRVTAYCDLHNADIRIDGAGAGIADSGVVYAKTFLLDTLTNCIDVEFYSPPEKKEINLFGFNLSNGKSGVFYHSIGINGAKYCDFCNKDLFGNQLSLLNPQLVIVSFGTNEAMSKVINEANIDSNIAELVSVINSQLPNAVIMFTTPAETYTRNRSKPNVQIGKIRNIIVNYAEKNGYPYWDLYSITGGKGSALNWFKKRLMTRDKIHLTQYGYEYQGELLFEAIVKSYNTYIKGKHGV